MPDRIHLLDFRRGTVEEVDNPAPPHGLKGSAPMRAHGEQTGESAGAGYVLTTLGSPPRPDEGEHEDE